MISIWMPENSFQQACEVMIWTGGSQAANDACLVLCGRFGFPAKLAFGGRAIRRSRVVWTGYCFASQTWSF